MCVCVCVLFSVTLLISTFFLLLVLFPPSPRLTKHIFSPYSPLFYSISLLLLSPSFNSPFSSCFTLLPFPSSSFTFLSFLQRPFPLSYLTKPSFSSSLLPSTSLLSSSNIPSLPPTSANLLPSTNRSAPMPYKKYFGGACIMTEGHLQQVNGWSNSYWGWGGEDDDMWRRMQLSDLSVWRYPAHYASYKMVAHKPQAVNPNR